MNKNSIKKQLQYVHNLSQQGDLAAAKSACLAILEANKSNHEALNLLGQIELQLGNNEQALDPLSEAAKLNGKIAHYHITLAVCLLRLHRFDEAEKNFQKALKIEPRNILVQKGMGELLCRKAAELDSQPTFRLAEKYLRKALAKLPRDIGVLVNLSHTLQKLNRQSEALKYGLKALSLNPANEDANHVVGNIYSELGDFEKALTYHRASLTSNPYNSLAFRNFVAAKKFTPEDPDLKLVSQQEARLKKGGIDNENARILYFALGKIYDDLGNWDRAFSYFQLANNLTKVSFDRSALTKKHNKIKNTFSQLSVNTFSDDSPDTVVCPVFIVGMPRSGSSLVEQIITKHPKLIGLGEYQGIYDIINTLDEEPGGNDSYLGKVGSMSEKQKIELRNLYLKGCPGKGIIPVDKMLSNFENIGLITWLFPDAKIIHCVRNPLDVCLSCFTQDFVSHASHTYDLDDLAYFYKEYKQMMDFWRDRQSANILDVSYEELVGDLPTFSKKMLEFCGVEWEEGCLDFYSNTRAVQTSSKWQVRQPIYKTSLNRWKNYEKHLGKLIQSLDSLLDENIASQNTRKSIASKLNPFRLFG